MLCSRTDTHINVSWQPFLSSELSQISHSHSASRSTTALPGGTEPVGTEKQGQIMVEALEQEAAQQTQESWLPGESVTRVFANRPSCQE